MQPRPMRRLPLLLLLLVVLLASSGGLALQVVAQMRPSRVDDRPQGAQTAAAKAEAETVLSVIAERASAVRALTSQGKSIQDAPPFEATPREEELTYFPCSDCHEDQITNRNVRELKEEHTDILLEHGGGRFWCYDACHNAGQMDTLKSLRGEPIKFDESYLLCGQCHFERQRDWYFGGHGKRAGSFERPRDVPATYADIDFSERENIGTWRDERVILNCTACHSSHSPAIKPYEPSPPPQVRRGLVRKKPRAPDHEATLWLRLAHEREKAQ